MPVEFDTLSSADLSNGGTKINTLPDEFGFYGQTFTATSPYLSTIEFAVDHASGPGPVEMTVMIATVRFDAGGFHPDQVVFQSALLTIQPDAADGMAHIMSVDTSGLTLVEGQRYVILFNANSGDGAQGDGALNFVSNPQNDAEYFVFDHTTNQDDGQAFAENAWYQNPADGSSWGDVAIRLSYVDPIVVVNFDATTSGSPATYSEDGLTFTSPTHLHFNSGDMDGDGFQELYGHSGGTDTIYITKTGGGSFSLVDMDTVVNGSVELIAYRMVGGSLVETGRMVISAGTTQVTFTAAFQNIDQVLWNSGYGGSMLVDNIRYTTGAVPPSNSAPDAPVDNDAATADVLAENAANGTYAGITLHSSDADGDAITYSLTDDAGGRFRVDAATGAVVATGAVNIDYEHAPFSDANGRYYEVTAIGTDPDGAASNPTTYRIYVTNVVETPFTDGNDGSAAQPVDFNAIRPGAYEPDGTFQYSGLDGDDYVILPDQATVASGRNPWDYAQAFQAGNGNDMVQGGDGNDVIAGDAGNDRLFGDAGNDQLLGGTGHDVLAGGSGTDRLTGGDGRDIFLFGDSEIGSSKTGAHDVITDFTQGVDLIDISALYDGVAFAGFKFGKLSSALKNGAPVDAYKVAYYGDGVSIWVQGDTTGDGIADFSIELTGARALAGTPATVAASFIVDAAGWDGAMAGRSLAYDWAGHHQDGYWL